MGLVKLILTVIFILFIPSAVFSQEVKQVTIVNPIRGNDFYTLNQPLLTTSKKELEIIQRNNLPATWLLRYDALKDDEVIAFIKSLPKNHEVGIFLEVTPSLTKDAGVNYNQSENWHYAKSVLVTGYSPETRKKLTDTIFKKFREVVGTNPNSVGAWWIDGGSLVYMKEKYGIEANLNVADQYSTDGYQVWGQYYSTPFYPAKLNALMPASSIEQKIGIVTIQWATRDPFNAYGNGVFDSTYSVQTNDYLLHELNTSYFEKLLDVYPHTTVGLENDFSWQDNGAEYSKQIEVLAKRQKEGKLQLKTISGYAGYYKKQYQNLSPNVLISADDPLGSEGKVVWYQTPKYRVGLFHGVNGTAIRDLRQYNDREEEPCLKISCDELNLARTVSQALDDVTYQTRWVLDEGTISEFSTKQVGETVEISYKNAAGSDRKIRFLTNDIEVDGKMFPLSVAILNSISNQNIEKQNQQADLGIDWNQNLTKIVINFGRFIILTVLFFLIPGLVLSRNWWLAIPTGWVLFTLLSFGLGYLSNFWQLLWILPILSILGLLRYKPPKIQLLKVDLKNILVGAVIMVGSVTWLLTQVKNGLLYNYGYGFWGPNGHDAIWHLALISELQRNFPPQNPVFAGEVLRNYHYFYDLLLARAGQLMRVDSQEMLFRLFPLFIAVLVGVLVYLVTRQIARLLSSSQNFGFLSGLLALFFVYFGGSFGWLVSYFRNGSLGGESMFWSQQAISTLLNPPYAISLVIYLVGLYLFLDLFHHERHSGDSERIVEDARIEPGRKFWPSSPRRADGQNDFIKFVTLSLLWGSLIEFKAYIGVLVLGALFLFGIEKAVKKDFRFLVLFGLCSLISAIIFLPNNFGGSSLIVFMPLWLVWTMISFQDRLSWQRLDLAIQSGVHWKVVIGYLVGIGIFLLGNFGTRVIGFLKLRELIKIRILFYIFILGIILPLLFVQKGNNWNIIQFFYYSSFILAIFAGISLASIVVRVRKVVGSVIVILVIALTAPTTFDALHQYLPDRPPTMLSRDEIKAMEFLNAQPAGTVLTVPFDDKLKNKFTEPVLLLSYTSTSYVAAFSGHPTFLEDTINLEILGVDAKARLNDQRDFFRIRERSKNILSKNNISYVYLPKTYNIEIDEGKMGIKSIFENSEVRIFKKI